MKNMSAQLRKSRCKKIILGVMLGSIFAQHLQQAAFPAILAIPVTTETVKVVGASIVAVVGMAFLAITGPNLRKPLVVTSEQAQETSQATSDTVGQLVIEHSNAVNKTLQTQKVVQSQQKVSEGYPWTASLPVPAESVGYAPSTPYAPGTIDVAAPDANYDITSFDPTLPTKASIDIPAGNATSNPSRPMAQAPSNGVPTTVQDTSSTPKPFLERKIWGIPVGHIVTYATPQAVNIGLQILDQIVAKIRVFGQRSIKAVIQEEKYHQHMCATNQTYKMAYDTKCQEIESLLSQATGQLTQADRFTSTAKLFYKDHNKLVGWDHAILTQTLNQMKPILLDSNGNIRAQLTVQEKSKLFELFTSYQQMMGRLVALDQVKIQQPSYKINTSRNNISSVSEFISTCHRRGIKAAHAWIKSTEGTMPYEQEKRAVYQAHKELFDTIAHAFEEKYAKFYTKDGLLKVAMRDPLWTSLSANKKQEIVASPSKLKKLNMVLAMRNERRLDLMRQLHLSSKSSDAVARHLFDIIDLEVAHAKPQDIIDYVVSRCATPELYHYFFDKSGAIKLYPKVGVELPNGTRPIPTTELGKELLKRVNYLAFVKVNEINEPYIPRAYEYLAKTYKETDHAKVQAYLTNFDTVFDALVMSSITAEIDTVFVSCDAALAQLTPAASEKQEMVIPAIAVPDSRSVPTEQEKSKSKTDKKAKQEKKSTIDKIASVVTLAAAIKDLTKSNPAAPAQQVATVSLAELDAGLLEEAEKEYAEDSPDDILWDVDTDSPIIPPNNGPEDEFDDDYDQVPNEEEAKKLHLSNYRKLRDIKLQKAKRSKIRRLKEHVEKLKGYINDPYKYDNEGHLRNATSPYLKNKIYNTRIRILKGEIKIFMKEIIKINAVLSERGLL